MTNLKDFEVVDGVYNKLIDSDSWSFGFDSGEPIEFRIGKWEDGSYDIPIQATYQRFDIIENGGALWLIGKYDSPKYKGIIATKIDGKENLTRELMENRNELTDSILYCEKGRGQLITHLNEGMRKELEKLDFEKITETTWYPNSIYSFPLKKDPKTIEYLPKAVDDVHEAFENYLRGNA